MMMSASRIASVSTMVGATARLESDRLVIRQGRQLVVRTDMLEDSMRVRIPVLPITIAEAPASRVRKPNAGARKPARAAIKQTH